MAFGLVTLTEGSACVFHLRGELDLAERDSLAEAVITMIPYADKVVLDLSELEFVDSSGLSALLRCRNHAREHGRPFAVRGANGLVANVLKITELDDALSGRPTA